MKKRRRRKTKEERFLKFCQYLAISSSRHKRKLNKGLYLRAYKCIFKNKFKGEDILDYMNQLKKKYYPTNCRGTVLAAAMAVGAVTQILQITKEVFKNLKVEGENN